MNESIFSKKPKNRDAKCQGKVFKQKLENYFLIFRAKKKTRKSEKHGKIRIFGLFLQPFLEWLQKISFGCDEGLENKSKDNTKATSRDNHRL